MGVKDFLAEGPWSGARREFNVAYPFMEGREIVTKLSGEHRRRDEVTSFTQAAVVAAAPTQH